MKPWGSHAKPVSNSQVIPSLKSRMSLPPQSRGGQLNSMIDNTKSQSSQRKSVKMPKASNLNSSFMSRPSRDSRRSPRVSPEDNSIVSM